MHPRHVYDLQARLYQKGAALLPMAHGELVYQLHQWVPHLDRGLTRHVLANNGIGGLKEYEVEVAQSLSRLYPKATLSEFKERLDNWRGQGLLHVLMLAARRMPTLNDWLPVDKQGDAERWADVLSEANAAKDADMLGNRLNLLFQEMDWGSPACLSIAGTLDRLAVLMRVRSNAAGSFGLDEALQAFPASPDWIEILLNGKGHLERCMPPSVLCPRLHGHPRPTWGYQRLTPKYVDGALRFVEDKLEWIEPVPGSSEAVPALLTRPGDSKTDAALATGARLADMLCRIGELLLSPEMGHVLMLSLEGTEFIKKGECNISDNEVHICRTPSLLLHFMEHPELLSEREDIAALKDALFASMPGVSVKGRTSLVAWRVDPPAHVVLCAGEPQQLLEPHRLRRVILPDERSVVRSVGGIALGSGQHQEHVLFHASQMQPVTEKGGHTHTALLEGLVCFGLSLPLLHTQVMIHSSVPWDSTMPEDTRYAETQLASNGKRFRDWVCLHDDQKGRSHKCRLESHVIHAEEVYHTSFPWVQSDGSTKWVHVASSLHPSFKVLHDRTTGGTLAAAVKSRFLQDLRLLPVRKQDEHRVERGNASVYAGDGQVLLAYAPSGDDRLEFMLFQEK